MDKTKEQDTRQTILDSVQTLKKQIDQYAAVTSYDFDKVLPDLLELKDFIGCIEEGLYKDDPHPGNVRW
jgi:hypothetical protein